MSIKNNIFNIIKEALESSFSVHHMEDNLEFCPNETYSSLDKIVLYNYTALINVSGMTNGYIILSCNQEFLAETIKLILGPRIHLKEEYYIDMVGETSNTVAGYFQKFYGDNFLISAPVFINKKESINIKYKVANMIQVLKFSLLGFESMVIVGFN